MSTFNTPNTLNPLNYTLGQLQKAFVGATVGAASALTETLATGKLDVADVGIILGAALVGFLGVFGFKNADSDALAYNRWVSGVETEPLEALEGKLSLSIEDQTPDEETPES